MLNKKISIKIVDLSRHIIGTYQRTRVGLVFIGFAFPLILWFLGKTCAQIPLQDSISAYYHASAGVKIFGNGTMRDWFVGMLFTIGVILYLYKGFTRLEDYALNLAGLFAVGTAIFPMSWPSGENHAGISLHGFCAISMFLCIAYVCIFRASDTLKLITDEVRRNRYCQCYHLLGYAMVVLPVTVWLINWLGKFSSYVFFLETAGIYVFATYWWVKSHEISVTSADQMAAQGKLTVAPHGLSDAFRHIEIVGPAS